MRLLAATLLLLTLAAPALAAKDVLTRYSSPDGWRLQTREVWNPVERIESARSRGMPAVPPMLDMMIDTQHEYDWLECGIVVRDGVVLEVGPFTRIAIVYDDSLRVVGDRLVFPDRTFMQHWDSQQGEIWLGLTGNREIYHSVGKAKGFTERGRVNAIVYLAFALLPHGSSITESNVKQVMVTGVQGRSAETKHE